jgi:hypothetical protein
MIHRKYDEKENLQIFLSRIIIIFIPQNAINTVNYYIIINIYIFVFLDIINT